MQYNVCEICGAKDGRAGMTISDPTLGLVDACLNCHHTRTQNKIVIHSHLSRTEEELQKTFNILNEKT